MISASLLESIVKAGKEHLIREKKLDYANQIRMTKAHTQNVKGEYMYLVLFGILKKHLIPFGA